MYTFCKYHFKTVNVWFSCMYVLYGMWGMLYAYKCLFLREREGEGGRGGKEERREREGERKGGREGGRKGRGKGGQAGDTYL